MENKFYQKMQLKAITAMDWQSEQEIKKDWVRVINLGAGRWKKMVCDDARLFMTQTRGIQTSFFLFPQNNPQPPPRLLHSYCRKAVPKNR